jgi:hypothetical protein
MKAIFPSKRLSTLNGLYGVMSHKIEMFLANPVGTSNST